MLEDQVAYLLQRYLGNYVRGLNKDALKISVWQGDVELTNMQLKPEALNALKLPVKVKAGFLGSVKLKVPWSRLGQDPVLVYLDRIFLLAEPATLVEGSNEDAVQTVKKNRIREMELKLLETREKMSSEMNKSWLGSLINTVIGNLKLSISNIHIRYEDTESNPGHWFAAGITLDNLSAFTVDDNGKETFVTGDSLERIQKSVELERLAIYWDSDISPWRIDKHWEDLSPFEWSQIFKFGTKDGKPSTKEVQKHSYVLQPVSGKAFYSKDSPKVSESSGQALQSAVINLDDVSLCLSRNGYRDLLKLADNFTAFNQRLQYAHYRPFRSVKTDPNAWWKYACKAISDQVNKGSGKLSWEQVLRFTRLRKKYISLYATLLKSDLNQPIVDENKVVDELDRELDIEVILQWRMLAHKFVEQSTRSDYLKKQQSNKSWWPFGWSNSKDENEPGALSKEDWERLNDIIGFKEGTDKNVLISERGDIPYLSLKLHMKHNSSKLIDLRECLADLSCDNLDFRLKLYSEAKVFDVNLGSYQLFSPNGLLAQSESASDSLVGIFCYKPVDADVDWSMVAKASPCYVTYLKDSIGEIINFFQENAAVSQTLARETASAVQMTLDEVKRTATKQVNRALKERLRFLVDFDIAAPKITIPTDFYPDGVHPTKLLLDLGKLSICSQDDAECTSPEEMDVYSQFNLVLRDISAFLVDGDYEWSSSENRNEGSSQGRFVGFLPIIDKCGVFLKLQQMSSPIVSFSQTRLSVRLPSIHIHFSPSRYHRLNQVVKIFQGETASGSNTIRPWSQSDFEGWLFKLSWKGVGGREAVWQRRYFYVVGPFFYELENPNSRNYDHYFSLRGKQLYQIPAESVGGVEHVLGVCDSERSNNKVVEDANAIILRFESDNLRRTWQYYLQGAIYRVSGAASVTGIVETSSDSDESELGNRESKDLSKIERLFLTGILEELKISLSYSSNDKNLTSLLLTEERSLIEFRAIGGKVEFLIRENDIFIGTILKALEVEDLVCRKRTSRICYLARSFFGNEDRPFSLGNNQIQMSASDDLSKYEGDDEFYDADDNLNDSVGSPLRSSNEMKDVRSVRTGQSDCFDFEVPSFDRVPGLLPIDGICSVGEMGATDALGSFVKAHIIIFYQNSSLYANVDNQVAVTLSTLSFFCRRHTILAIMEFIDAINTKDDICESASDFSSTAVVSGANSVEGIENDALSSVPTEEPVMKSLLGKGKSRVIFSVVLNMSLAEIFLMKENDSYLATLSQNNFLTDIKVFPSSFSIKASLGDLKISDNILGSTHMYFWACDTRNPGGTSFVELGFCSFNAEDDDYEGYDYSLLGQLSAVRIIYLNRFLQEVVSYFTGLFPGNSDKVVRINDQITNTEKYLAKSEMEGSPALKLDLSLNKPIILMPQRSNSVDYLKLDVGLIAIQNTFRWIGGSITEIKSIHLEILKIFVEDINLNVGSGPEMGESILQDVRGVSIVIQRSLRDLFHQIPVIEVSIEIEALKAVLSNKEYDIISECAQANISETPDIVPLLIDDPVTQSVDVMGHGGSYEKDHTSTETHNLERWITTMVSVRINLVELSIHYGMNRDASLATLQINGVWLSFKSNVQGVGFLLATVMDLIVVDDREGTEPELRFAIGKTDMVGHNLSQSLSENLDHHHVEDIHFWDSMKKFVPPLLILDARFCEKSTFVSLSIQRPQLLVALDFLLAIVEFFVPAIRGTLSNEENSNSSQDALILDQPVFSQPYPEFTITPQKPLIVCDEKFDIFTYDGRGGILYLKQNQGLNLSHSSKDALIFVGNGKRLQFTNVTIKSGKSLDSCIQLGSCSSYSINETDNVILEEDNIHDPFPSGNTTTVAPQNTVSGSSSELIFELQAISPELTFYHTSRNGGSINLSNKLLHAQLDAFCRVAFNENTLDMNADAVGLTMESNGIKILEPFDTSLKFSNTNEQTSMHISVSDIFMNFSFSILSLFLAVEEDILSFLRTTSKKSTVLCSEFDRIGSVKNPFNDQVYAFWRPRAPTGFVILGDYLTPIDKPPSKSVIAVNRSLIQVKRPKSFILLWPPSGDMVLPDVENNTELATEIRSCHKDSIYSVWFPEAPEGYVALGCVASPGREHPPISSVFCILTSLVYPCGLRDCISIGLAPRHPNMAFWRADNSFGTFLPADPTTLRLSQCAYELRKIYFKLGEFSEEKLNPIESQVSTVGNDTIQLERSSAVNSRQRFEAVATFRLIWWNHGSGSRKNLSIWRPVVPEGKIYFGDIAVQGYEPPNTCIILQELEEDCDLYKVPLDFQLVQHIKKYSKMDRISFWMPQAPPGFVSLGCVAAKNMPKQSEFSSLRCIRSDMVTMDQFLEDSIWDTSDFLFTKEPFSIWAVDNELGTFIVQNGLKKPPRRLSFKLVGPDISNGSDEIVVDAEIRTFSAALFDDYGGLMAPLCNVSLSGIRFSLHGRSDSWISSVLFSLAARSYNDEYESWEPLIEMVDGSLRYLQNPNTPGTASQLRVTSQGDLNLNVSVSNVNMILQAYASWNNLSHAQESQRQGEAHPFVSDGRFMTAVHKKTNYYIVPQNALGKDIFIRASDIWEFPGIIKTHAGDTELKFPVPKNMLDSHLKGSLLENLHVMVTIIIAEAELPKVEHGSSCQYSVTVHLYKDSNSSGKLYLKQRARTCGISSDGSNYKDVETVSWNEAFFFKIDSVECWMVEFIVTETGKGDPIGYYLSSIEQLVSCNENSCTNNHHDKFLWLNLSPVENLLDMGYGRFGRLKFALFFPLMCTSNNLKKSSNTDKSSGKIQLSSAREGPWSSVKLNYGAPVLCWRFGNDVVASEVRVAGENRYISIRSLVSIRNSTDITLEFCLELKPLNGSVKMKLDERNESQYDGNEYATDETCEFEKFNSSVGWIPCNDQLKVESRVELPLGWEWIDEWHVDTSSVNTPDGWVYAPQLEDLKCPESYNSVQYNETARQRRRIRNRKRLANDFKSSMILGPLKPGEVLPIPLPCLGQSDLYVLHVRPSNEYSAERYAWSSVIDKSTRLGDLEKSKGVPEICVSSLTESENILYCSEIGENSSQNSHGMWFCLTTQASEIAKDIHFSPIMDWTIVVKSPVTIANYLPFMAEISVLEMQSGGHFLSCFRGVFSPGETINVYNSDIRNPLYLSFLPQRGWLPVHEAVLVSDPSHSPSMTMNLRSSISGRIVQIFLEQNHTSERSQIPMSIKVYSPYWIRIARCPPIRFRLIDLNTRRPKKIKLPFQAKNTEEVILEEITDEEVHEGYTIASALNFKSLGMSASISHNGGEKFGPVKDLSPLGDMDGSLDLFAYNDEGNCIQLFLSSKPCPYHSIPTKVITIRPFVTFTNRVGQNIFLKFSSQDEPKVLKPSDSRVSFVYKKTDECNGTQVRMDDTEWSFPLQIAKEDSITLSLKKSNGLRNFLLMEIRGYEEGSRFVVVFRLGYVNGPIRVENRTKHSTISFRQTGFGEDSWIQLQPLSTTNFSWEDPYGQKFIDADVHNGGHNVIQFDLDKLGLSWANDDSDYFIHVTKMNGIKVVRFMVESARSTRSIESGSLGRNSDFQAKLTNQGSPLELVVELGVVGISMVDHRPRELAYLYMEKVFLSYSTGYDGGTTSRFKLVLGYLQLDNQLPLTVMPVLLAPEQSPDLHNPVFKMTITARNEHLDGIQIYPYVYIRVIDKLWKLNIHEPIMWALIDCFNNLQIDRIPQNSSVTQVDPEIRVNLIDISEVKLKVSLETAPAERPQGLLGVWGPVLSAVGNAFKIQVHLRKVVHEDRFLRKSHVSTAIGNRIWRDLIHNPLHLIFSVDVLGMTSSTFSSLSKGFAEISTDGQFLQLRSKQVWSRRITGVGDGIVQGTEAFAQGVAFGLSGVVRKPVQSARQHGILGLARGLGQAFLGFFVQPMSGALDFVSLTVDGIGASCSRCLEILSNKKNICRIRNPRAFHSDNILRDYSEKEALGQMILYLAEASRSFGCTVIFKEPSKFAWSDCYEDHFVVPYQRIVLVTNRRVMLLQSVATDMMGKQSCKILWDVPWENVLALELAKAGYLRPSHLIIHLKNFNRAENFVRVIKCNTEEPQAIKICSVIRKMWKMHKNELRSSVILAPSSQRHFPFSWSGIDGKKSQKQRKIIDSINFTLVWSSEQVLKGGCKLCRRKIFDKQTFSIWRAVCPDGYVSVGDIARVGSHPPNFAALYCVFDRFFAPPVGYDLVWRNCLDDYKSPVSIWSPRAPDGFVSLGCVAVSSFTEPEFNTVYCVAESLVEETTFEEQKVWSATDSYPWACHIYQVCSNALFFAALRQPREESEWKPKRVMDNHPQLSSKTSDHD